MGDSVSREKSVIIVSMVIRTFISVIAVAICFHIRQGSNPEFPAIECLIGIVIGNIGYVVYDISRIRRLGKDQPKSTKIMRL